MITLTDTHAHLYASEFDSDRDEMFGRARQLGVKRFFLPNIDLNSVNGLLALAHQYPDTCFPMMGLHPCSITNLVEQQLHEIKTVLNKHKFYAIGEIGIDLYWDKTFFEQQKIAFKEQMLWALEYQLPVAIHCRNAMNEILEILEELKQTTAYKDCLFKGIFHCFSGNAEEANKLVQYGFYLGIGGVITFKNSGLDKAIQNISLNNLVLETDAPYLAPVPFRGKRNESAYLRYVAEKLAEIKNCSLMDVATITTQNSIRIFGV